MSITIASILSLMVTFQEPSMNLQSELELEDPSARFYAAQEIALLPEVEIDRWLVKNALKGAPQRQRAMLLACALRGGEECWKLIDKQTLLRSNNPQRPWALFLSASFNGEYGRNPKPLIKRARSKFEIDSILLGLMANPSVTPEVWQLAKWDSRNMADHLPAVSILAALNLEDPKWNEAPSSMVLVGKAICSLLPSQSRLSDKETAQLVELFGGLWSVGATNSNKRNLDKLQQLPINRFGGAVAMCLLEVDDSDAAAIFEFLDSRIQSAQGKNWLWGIAGERLGISFDYSTFSQLHDWHAAALISRYRINEEEGTAMADSLDHLARQRLLSSDNLEIDWPAAVCLALSSTPSNWKLLQSRIEERKDSEMEVLYPIWQLASGRLTKAAQKQKIWEWVEQMEAGWVGYMQNIGETWSKVFLLSGTQALDSSRGLTGIEPQFQRELDYSPSHLLYADLAELISSKLYRWEIKN